MSAYVAERKHNPFINSPTGGRRLSALQEPFFRLMPPAGFGVLEMTGRKSGVLRRKCVRAIRRGNRVYLVSIRPTAWLANVRADPHVRLRIRGGTFTGVVREVGEGDRAEARQAYCETVNPFDYGECLLWRKGRPTKAKIRELHSDWFEQGTPLVVELAVASGPAPG